jgi:DNA segregation ATPase FtsK/SpoIIIE, S-DNA-T family
MNQDNNDLKKAIKVLEDRIAKIEEFLKPQMEAQANFELCLAQAISLISQQDTVSASFLQRKLAIGYARAARILDVLEEKGYVGKGEGAKPRVAYKKNPN